MKLLSQEIENTLAHPAFYKDEMIRKAKYDQAVELGHDLLELPISAEGLVYKWEYLNRISIIPFYSLEDSLFHIMQLRGLLLEQCLRPLAKKIRLKASSSPKRKILIIKPGLNRGPELSSTVAHFKLLPKFYDVAIACQVVPTRDVAEKLIELGFALALLPNTIEEMVNAIVNFKPDIIIYSSNQSAVTNTQVLLGSLRLAPIQVATTMSPVTTGLRNMDFYLTGRDNEPPRYSGKYTESLLFVNGNINHYDPNFLDESSNAQNDSNNREAMKYRELFVGGNANKIGAPSLKVWLDILTKVADTRLILAPFNPNWQSHYPTDEFETWLRQLSEQNNLSPDRISVIGPFPSRKPILDKVRAAALYLDTFPYSGAVSIMDPITTRTQFITLSGGQARFRQASMMAMRTPELGHAVESEDSYIKKAINLLSSTPTQRENKRSEIEQRVNDETPSYLSKEISIALASI